MRSTQLKTLALYENLPRWKYL